MPPDGAAEPELDGGAGAGAPLTLMAFNVWQGGTNVRNGHAKVRDAIAAAGADVVAMQESSGLAPALADELGWYAVQPAWSVAVLSRYPISEVLGVALHDAAVGVRIELPGPDGGVAQDLVVWSAHLTPSPYAPYDACLDHLAAQRIVRRQEDTQLPEAADIAARLAPFMDEAGESPVFLLGDFNTPSHLDWVAETADLHCGYALDLPVTAALAGAGLIDAYRELHPDPRTDRGDTWSPVYRSHVYPDGTPEPLDRIDMVHHAPGVEILEARVLVLGDPRPYPDHRRNEWPSDHAAVVVRAARDVNGRLTVR